MRDVTKLYRTLLGEALQAIDGETLGIKAMTLVERAGIELNALGDRLNPEGTLDPEGWGGWQDLGYTTDAGVAFTATDDSKSYEGFSIADYLSDDRAVIAKFGQFDPSANLRPYLDAIDRHVKDIVTAATPLEWKTADPKSLERVEGALKLIRDAGFEPMPWQERIIETVIGKDQDAGTTPGGGSGA